MHLKQQHSIFRPNPNIHLSSKYPKATIITQDSNINKTTSSINTIQTPWHLTKHIFITKPTNVQALKCMFMRPMHDLPHLPHYITTPIHQCIIYLTASQHLYINACWRHSNKALTLILNLSIKSCKICYSTESGT